MIASGCATTAQTPADRSYKPISGSIPLDSSIILKKAVAVEIQLLDVTIPSEEAKQLSKQIIKNPKKTPVNFSLRFEETDIQAFGSTWSVWRCSKERRRSMRVCAISGYSPKATLIRSIYPCGRSTEDLWHTTTPGTSHEMSCTRSRMQLHEKNLYIYYIIC